MASASSSGGSAACAADFFAGNTLARRQRVGQRGVGRRTIAGQRGLLAGKRADRLVELRDLLCDAGLVLARERELLLQASDFSVGRVVPALLLVQGVAGRVVLAAQRLEPRLRGAHVGEERVERDGQRGDLGRATLLRAERFLLLAVPQHLLRLFEARLVLAVLRRHLRLLGEARQLVPELDPDVLDAREVLARIGQPSLGLLAAFLVLRHAGGFLEEDAELLGLRLDDARDHSLLDDRVGTRPEAGTEEEVVDVAAADRDVVDVVRRIAVARQHALDRELGVLAPLPANAALAVVEMQLDRRAAHRLALAGAVEDDVLHRFAAQRRRLRLAQHPADGIDDVRLAAAVRADDADELSGRADGRRVDERLEPGELDLGEAQGGGPKDERKN